MWAIHHPRTSDGKRPTSQSQSYPADTILCFGAGPTSNDVDPTPKQSIFLTGTSAIHSDGDDCCCMSRNIAACNAKVCHVLSSVQRNFEFVFFFVFTNVEKRKRGEFVKKYMVSRLHIPIFVWRCDAFYLLKTITSVIIVCILSTRPTELRHFKRGLWFYIQWKWLTSPYHGVVWVSEKHHHCLTSYEGHLQLIMSSTFLRNE